MPVEVQKMSVEESGLHIVILYDQTIIKQRCIHRVRSAVVKLTKHGQVVPFILPCVSKEVFLRSGDVHPLPGPTFIQQNHHLNLEHSVRNFVYSTKQLFDYSKAECLPAIDPGLKLRLHTLDLLSTALVDYMSRFKTSWILTMEYTRRNKIRTFAKSKKFRNPDNCVIISPNIYANKPISTCCIISRMPKQRKSVISIRITAWNSYAEQVCSRGNKQLRGTNCIFVPITVNKENQQQHKKVTLPRVCLINARYLLFKIDELTMLLQMHSMSLVAITETWVREDIDNELVSIFGCNMFHKDCSCRRGGRICVYVSQDSSAKRRIDLENSRFECLWLWLRPTCLPRPLSGIAICVLYHPPGQPVQEHRDLNEYLVTTTDTLRNQYPDGGLIFLGDFNDFNMSSLATNHILNQVVEAPTRGSSILYLIVTNLQNFYQIPRVLVPLETAGHNIITWVLSSEHVNRPHAKPVKRSVRSYPLSAVNGFGRKATSFNWFIEVGTRPSVDDLNSSFTSHLTEAIDRIFPLKTIKCHQSDKPWIVPTVKALIKDRQKAFHNRNKPLFQSLKYKVQTKIKEKDIL